MKRFILELAEKWKGVATMAMEVVAALQQELGK